MTPVARAYDAIACEYDAHLARDPVAGYMRLRLHEHMRRLFHPGDRILDLTAGTGADACYLAGLGVQVMALDASPGMLAELQRLAARRNVQIETRVLPAECLDELDAHDLDGAISTFAGLNTMDDLPRLAHNLAVRLKPRGRVLFHALNSRFSNPILYEVSIGGQVVPHKRYNPYALWREAFADYFDMQSVYALSVVAGLPLVRRFPFAMGPLFALDPIVGRIVDQTVGRIFPAVGDFFVMELEKQAL